MDQPRPRTVVWLTVYWNFESWRTAQNQLRLVLTGLFIPKASQGYVMFFINFKSNFTEFLALFPPSTVSLMDITCQSPTTTSSTQWHANRQLPHTRWLGEGWTGRGMGVIHPLPKIGIFSKKYCIDYLLNVLHSFNATVSFTLQRAVHVYQINLTEIYMGFTLIQVGACYSTNNKREIFIWHHQRWCQTQTNEHIVEGNASCPLHIPLSDHVMVSNKHICMTKKENLKEREWYTGGKHLDPPEWAN